MAVNPDLKKRKKFVRAIVAGKTQAEAAIAAGYSEKSAHTAGSQIADQSETKSLLARAIAEHDMGVDRYVKELERGLKGTRPEGKHGEYVDRLAKLHKIAQDDKTPGDAPTAVTVNILAAIQQAKSSGIIPNDPPKLQGPA